MTCQCGEIREMAGAGVLRFVCACGHAGGSIVDDGKRGDLHAARLANLERSFVMVHDEHPEWKTA